MTGRQRALAALRHEEPDRVPVDYWATRETDANLCAALGLAGRGQILDRFGVDFHYISGPAYIGPPLRRIDEHADVDVWGVPRRKIVVGEGRRAQSYENVIAHPLADAQAVADVLDYPHWPDPDWFDYSVIADQCRQAGDRCVMFMGDRLNRIAQLKPAMYLRGIAEILIDMLADPPLFQAIVDRIAAFYFEYLHRILKAAGGGIDVLVTGDDFGSQESLLCKPSLWRAMVRPNFVKFIDISHSYNVPVMHHTCGSVWEILPDLVECGLDILNPIQPGTRNMQPDRLKREFGDRLTFHGGVSIQRNLPFGTPDAVRAEVRDLMAAMKPGGGFWICTAHNIQADVPPENVVALFDAYHRFGRYP
jgi:uroporphyrinogen decarboxylase